MAVNTRDEKQEQEFREAMEEWIAEDAAKAKSGLCEVCNHFTIRQRCGCGWRLCEEHEVPLAHNNTCTFYP